ncbi:hypothetical protein AAGG74_19235 [Bacillus mexicanus]|uniref:hypothetical protein n=1 Tax=Bacillus mexicanus TaxID=2834415 RepID=UPI003D1A693A
MKFTGTLKWSSLRKNSFFLKKTYFFDQYSSSILLYRKDYLKLKNHFPFHIAQNIEDFILISLCCPYSKIFTYNSFSHYGKSLNINSTSVNNETLRMKSPPFIQANINDTLPNSFSACQLCKNELSCMFSSKKIFKADYDIHTFIETLKTKGYSHSTGLHNEFQSLYDEEGYLYEQPISFSHFIVLLIVAIPIIIFATPFFFARSFIENKKTRK